MPLPLRDYALIGDCHTGALVGLDGSIDWLCLPRFDSASMFGALLGDGDHGRWALAPADLAEGQRATSRAYLDDTFVLSTRWASDDGEVEVIDLMPHGDRRADVIRRVRGIRGTVRMTTELVMRFDYAAAMPWVRQVTTSSEDDEHAHELIAVAGPDAVVVRGPHLTPRDHRHHAEFAVTEGETVDLVLTWYPAHRDAPPALDVDASLEHTVGWWRDWASRSRTHGVYDDEVRRSLLVLRALTHEDTGGIVAAATTSLPEDPGGSRNWDYRYVWLRDAALTLGALMTSGYLDEAADWRAWLLRAIAGDPADVQIMYGLAGERRLPEWEVATLPGYLGATPVRVGNAAYLQYQGDIFGEVMMALALARDLGVEEDRFSWSLQLALLDYVEKNLDAPDNGIWEIRGPQRHFTHSRAMLWTAFDRGIRAVREHGLDGPVERWEGIRDRLREEIETHGFDAERGCYTQYYGGEGTDAALLTLPQVGYLEADDPRMLGTVAAMERELLRDGLLLRYRTESGVDGLPGDEHPFLACSFWLVEQYARSGRTADATALMDRLCGFANDVGLLSEEVDPATGAHVGNTPQALSHLALVRAAWAIADTAD